MKNIKTIQRGKKESDQPYGLVLEPHERIPFLLITNRRQTRRDSILSHKLSESGEGRVTRVN